jgi:hypothetical protein
LPYKFTKIILSAPAFREYSSYLKKEDEDAKTMTNLQSNLKGKRSIAIPSKDL